MNYSFRNQPTALALYNAFQDEPFYLAIAKARTNQAESIESALTKYFDFSIQEAKKYGICQTTKNPKAGASLWLQPQKATLQQRQATAKKAFLNNHLGEESWAVYKKIAQTMEQVEKGIIDRRYWYLSILAVAQAYQGQGLGRQLVTPVLAQADQLNIPTFLETFTEGNLIFYGKLGYEVAVEFVEPTLRKTGWVLVRSPA